MQNVSKEICQKTAKPKKTLLNKKGHFSNQIKQSEKFGLFLEGTQFTSKEKLRKNIYMKMQYWIYVTFFFMDSALTRLKRICFWTPRNLSTLNYLKFEVHQELSILFGCKIFVSNTNSCFETKNRFYVCLQNLWGFYTEVFLKILV